MYSNNVTYVRVETDVLPFSTCSWRAIDRVKLLFDYTLIFTICGSIENIDM